MQPWQQRVSLNFTQAVFVPLAGGSLADSYELRTRDEHYFVKHYNPTALSDSMVTWRESSALKELKRWDWPVPEVIMHEDSFMVLSWVGPGPSRQQEAAGAILGEILGRVHKRPAKGFSLPWGNSIGVLQDPGKVYSQAGDFYWSERLCPLLETLLPRYPLFREIIQWETSIRDFLNHSIHHPTLVHGDLWSGNFLWQADGTPFVIDPASYFGDPVADIAFSELFGGFPNSFYTHYWEEFGQDAHYACKKPLYQLYHALVHLKLFGKSYLNLSERLANEIFRNSCFKVMK
ncbi:MAG: fructosamine kinase family protein [Firmicutes bacterium]|nr:fructosamine kinase family protein [Bacillota bacterium]